MQRHLHFKTQCLGCQRVWDKSGVNGIVTVMDDYLTLLVPQDPNRGTLRGRVQNDQFISSNNACCLPTTLYDL